MNHILAISLLVTAFCLPAAFAREPLQNPPVSADHPQATQTEPNRLETDPRRFASEVLSGRQIVVRVYDTWQAEPATYKLVGVELDGLSVCFDAVGDALGKIVKSAVVVAAAEDQEDPAVAVVIGDYVYARYYKKGGRFSIWPCDSASWRPDCWTFKDALGQPIANADLQIFVSPTSTSKAPRLSLVSARIDEQGQLKKPIVRSDLQWFSFIISHRDYGIALVKELRNVTAFLAPLVKAGTEAEQRAARGVIVDSQNQPIRGASIQCYSVQTPGGGTLIRSRTTSVHDEVVTDQSGRFCLYLPVDNQLERLGGELIPLACKYDVQVQPPRELGLSPARQRISNHAEVTITLRSPQESRHERYFRNFLFEDANGPIIDPKRLERIEMRIWGKHSRVLKYKDWKDGGLFPLGKYEPSIWITRHRDRQQRRYYFQKLKVSEDSPQELVFRLVPARYAGQVIDGSTGQPVAGAFVLADCYEINTAVLAVTPEQWKAMHALPPTPYVYDETLAPLRAACRFYQVTRTNRNGFFQLIVTPAPSSHKICVVEEDYLPREVSFGTPRKHDQEIPVIRIFPAARVMLEPIKQGPVVVKPYWIIDANDNPTWVRDFVRTYGAKEIGISTIRPNQVHTIFVPASLKLWLQLRTSGKWCPITVPEPINLVKGELLDLGRQAFLPGLPVVVKVTDSRGKPVEGVMVNQLFEGLLDGWSPTRNPITDENGLAPFNVPAYSRGQFCIRTDGRSGPALRQTISYHIGGEEDTGRAFTIQLSDEMLLELLK